MFFSRRSKSERRKSFISNQIDDCKDLSALFYLLPFQKGYLVNWDTQRQIWDYVFGEDVLGIKPPDTNLIFSEPLFNFASIQDTLNEILFEEYKFKSVLRMPAPLFSYVNYSQHTKPLSCAVIVDTGYSFTHIVPVYKGKVVMEGVLRIDVGGKLLTNHLKEIVSYRQLHVLDETYVINHVKEDTCYVPVDFKSEMDASRSKKHSNSVRCEYVLPNFSDRKRGYIKDDDVQFSAQERANQQSLVLGTERISIPELLFSPSNIGIKQMGLAEGIVHSVSSTPSPMHPHLYSNIVLTGGNCLFPGFKQRIENDVRKLTPDLFTVNVFLPDDPVSYAWKGGALLTKKQPQLKHMLPVTLSEYRDYGHSIANKRFVESLQWME
jgi:actin-related protein 6